MSKRFGCACILMLMVHVANAGDVVPEQEYSKYVDKHRTVQALDASLFGEQVNLRDGGVQFRVVDGELAGNGPPIRIVRSFRIRYDDRFMETSGSSLGDWMLEVPRLKTITNNTVGTALSSSFGWQVDGIDRNARCTEFAPPSATVFGDPSRYWEPYEWWNGYQVVDDMGGEQEMLAVASLYPEVAGFKAVTSGNWRFSCLSSTANGEPGEGFLGTTPDGTRYWFDYLVYTTADTMTKPIGQMASMAATATDSTMGPVQDLMNRRHAMMLVTRIEDRFGNWLTYQYTSTGALTGIVASDGRVLEVDRTGSPITISLGTGTTKRTWSYGANSVGLPDGSAWTYNFSALTAAPADTVLTRGGGGCDISNNNTGSTIMATATAPSGVTGTFTFTMRRFGRSDTLRECVDPDGDGEGFVIHPADWFSYALAQRSFSGPGLPTRTWTYAYSPANASWSQDCTGGCTTEVWTDVTAPDGVRQRSVFSNRANETENLLLREETYTSGSTQVKKVEHAYATYPAFTTSTPYAWPRYLGADLQTRTNKARSERWTPALRHKTTLQGSTFTWEVPSTCGSGSACFDQFARPTRVVKSSTVAPTYTRTEAIAYHDNITQWILGQTASVTCVDANTQEESEDPCDGDVASATTFDAAYALPLTVSAFGKLQQTFTYDTTASVASGQRGTLKTVKDGRNQVTTFTNWKRGIPQSIVFADSTSRSAEVNDNGWITEVADENGYASSYDYDDMGRISQITPPASDSTNWIPTTRAFAPVTSAEHGIGAGHWRETVTTGTAVKTTYFDALWRPVLVHEVDTAAAGTDCYVATAYDSGGRVADTSYPLAVAPSMASNGTWLLSGVRPKGVRTSYDALGRPTTVQQDSELGVLTTTTAYLTGFQRRVTDARNNQTTEQFMAWDSPTFEWPVIVDAPENQRTTIVRDAFGKPLEITRAGVTP